MEHRLELVASFGRRRALCLPPIVVELDACPIFKADPIRIWRLVWALRLRGQHHDVLRREGRNSPARRETCVEGRALLSGWPHTPNDRESPLRCRRILGVTRRLRTASG